MKILFIITKGLEKEGSALRALQIAALTSEQGNHVEVFLIDEAVQWALGIKATSGKSLADYMDLLKTRDHPILVCQSCANKRLIHEEDLMDGTIMATMPMLVERIANPDYKIVTF
jgi:sulfur relay (sulfurtransferase) complex TusBCD TusD component (DsrE family)